MTRVRLVLVCLAFAAVPPMTSAQEKPRERADHVDLGVMHRIKVEAFQGQVMDHLFWLTDVNGPRLTGSPGLRTAADWAVRSLKSWGAARAEIEPWGTF